MAHPLGIGPQFRFHFEGVWITLIAHGAQRPAAMSFQKGVLYVLGDEARDVLNALWPLLDPPAPMGHRVFHQRYDCRVGHVASGEIRKHEGPGQMKGLLKRVGVVHGAIVTPLEYRPRHRTGS